MTGRDRKVVVASGLLLLAGGTLEAAAHQKTFSATVEQWPYQAGAWATLVGCMVIAVVMAGRPGARPAAIAAAAGSMLLAALAFSEATVNPALARSAPQLLDDEPATAMAVGLGIVTLGFAVGWLVLGVSMIRRHGRSAPAVGLVVAAVVSLAPMVPGPAVLGLALVWLATSSEGFRDEILEPVGPPAP